MKIPQILAAASALLAFLALPLQAQVFNYSGGPFSIPDGYTPGTPLSLTVSGVSGNIDSVNVTLNVTGNFNGDLYFDLRHGSATSILINQAGVTGSDPFGYDDHGYNVTLTANGNDIHTYRSSSPVFNGSGQLTGIWQADGRTDPASGSRPTSLNSFQGLDPNGQWTLWVADMHGNGLSQVQGWGVEITPVPEPQTIALATAASLLGFGVMTRLRKLFQQC